VRGEQDGFDPLDQGVEVGQTPPGGEELPGAGQGGVAGPGDDLLDRVDRDEVVINGQQGGEEIGGRGRRHLLSVGTAGPCARSRPDDTVEAVDARTEHPWTNLLATLERHRLPLLRLGSTPLSFHRDQRGILHPSGGGRACGVGARLGETRTTLLEAAGRCCPQCLTATQALSLGLGRHMLRQLAAAQPWLMVTEDLNDLLQVVTLVETTELLNRTGSFAEVHGLGRAGTLLRQILTIDEATFHPELVDHPAVRRALTDADEALSAWKTRCPGQTPTGVAVLRNVELTSGSESANTLGVVARRHPQPRPDAATLIIAVSEAEWGILELSAGTGASYGRAVHHYPDVPADRISILEGLWDSGLGEDDPQLPVRIMAALNDQ
jgi:hypothetical protein